MNLQGLLIKPMMWKRKNEKEFEESFGTLQRHECYVMWD